MASTHEQIRDQQKQSWDEFSPGWKKWDQFVMTWFSPVGAALVDRAGLRPDSTVLDIASGTGEPGLTAAARVPQGKVVLTDLSDRMLAHAQENARDKGLTNVEVKPCDAGALPFESASFDAVLCRYGFMFFPDVAHCATEFARVARPGARVCTAVWAGPEHNPWVTTVMSNIAKRVEMPKPPPGAPGMFRCAGPGMMTGAFEAAGLNNVAEEDVSGTVLFESPAHYWAFMTEVAAPVVAGLNKADEATRREIEQAVSDQLSASLTDGGALLPWRAKIIWGEK